MTELSKLKSLGLKFEIYLNEIGIFTESELQDYGPVRAFLNSKKNPVLHLVIEQIVYARQYH